MKPAIGGRRTRIRKTRPDRDKRRYPSASGRYPYPPNGNEISESMARPRLGKWNGDINNEMG